jgi:hypothetical protein
LFFPIYWPSFMFCISSRTKDLPYHIEWHTGKTKNDAEPIPSSITEISTFEPNDIMVRPYCF